MLENQLHEYYQLLEQLSESRDDARIHQIKEHLQEIGNRICHNARIEAGLVERYKRLEYSAHAHFLDIHSGVGGMSFCAVFNSLEGAGIHRHPFVDNRGCISSMSLRLGVMEIAMFVDVRETNESAKLGVNIPTIVGLQTLDECERINGKPRKRFLETIEDGRVFRRSNPQRESTLLFPSNGQGESRWIALDQIESEVIEGRPDLINGFTREDGNFVGGAIGKLKIVTTVRLSDSGIRLAFCVLGNEIAYSVNMFRCPDEFKVGGFKTTKHSNNLATFG